MNPEEMYTYSSPPPNGSRLKTVVWLCALFVVAFIITFGVVKLVKHTQPANKNNTKFSLVSTTPDTGAVTTQTLTMAVHFSQPIASNSVTVSSSPAVIASKNVQGSVLTLSFTPKTLSKTKTYTITIVNIRSTSGKQLTNQKLVFTPSFAAATTTGEDALSAAGLSSTQLDLMNKDISQFSPWAQSVAVNPANIKYYSENPNDIYSIWAISFSMNIDGKTYAALGEFYNTVDIKLTLSDPATGKHVFVAGNPGKTAPIGLPVSY